jgi:hypothetical protein
VSRSEINMSDNQGLISLCCQTQEAVNSVELNPEFEVVAPNVFITEIGPCGTP